MDPFEPVDVGRVVGGMESLEDVEKLTPEERAYRLWLARRRRRRGLPPSKSGGTVPWLGEVDVGGETFNLSPRYVEIGGELIDQRSTDVAPPTTAPIAPTGSGSDLPGYGVASRQRGVAPSGGFGYSDQDPTDSSGRRIDASQTKALDVLARLRREDIPTVVSGGTVLRADRDAPVSHDLKVLTDATGKEWLVPRPIAEDYEFQVGRHAFYTDQGYDLPAPELPKDMGVESTGMSDAEKAGLVKEYHEASTKADEKQATLDSVGRKLDMLMDYRDPSQIEAVKSTLTPAEIARFDEAVETHKDKIDRRTSAAHFIDRLSDFAGPVAFGKAIYSAQQPNSPGGIYSTRGEDIRTTIEAAGVLADITGVGALAQKGAAAGFRNVVRTTAPQKFGGGFLPGAFDKLQTTRVPLTADEFASQEFNLSRALASGKSAAVDVAGQIYKVDPSPAGRLMAELNPEQQIWYHAGDVSNLNPGGRVQPWDRSGVGTMTESVEDRIFGGPGDVYNRFADFSAGGTQHKQPGIVALAVPQADEMVVVPSLVRGPDFQNVMQIPRERIGLLGHTVDPEPGELRALIEGGFTREQAEAMASKPGIEGAVDVPGKTWHSAKEAEATFPSAHGKSEFVGVIPDLEPGPYAGSGFTTRLYVPKGVKTPSYSERLALNLEVVKRRAAQIAADPLALVRRQEGDFGLRKVDDVSDVRLPDSGDTPALTPGGEDARPTLVSREYPVDPGDARLVRLSRYSSNRLKRDFGDDPIAQTILRQRDEFDYGRLGDDLGDRAGRGDDGGRLGDDLGDGAGRGDDPASGGAFDETAEWSGDGSRRLGDDAGRVVTL